MTFEGMLTFNVVTFMKQILEIIQNHTNREPGDAYKNVRQSTKKKLHTSNASIQPTGSKGGL